MGLDIIRLHKNPMHTLLGLRGLRIQTVIDVGANKGQFSSYIRSVFPQACLYCFEPLPGPYKELQQWASLQKNVKLFNLALGDAEGTAKMFHHVEHSTSSSLLSSTELSEALYPFTQRQETIVVPLATLDGALDRVNEFLLPEILIKLDVQGYEERVIDGGRRIFSEAKACIVEVCLDELYSGQADFKRLVLTLYDLGFHYIGNLDQNFGDDGHVIFLDAVFIR